MTSPNVLSAVLADPRIASLPTLRQAKDPEVEIRKILQVMAVPNTYLLQVSTVTHSPTDSAALVNAVVTAYLNAATEWSDGMTRAQIKSLEIYQRELAAQKNEKSEALVALASKKDLANLGANAPARKADPGRSPILMRGKMTIEEVRLLRNDLVKANLELAQAQAMLTMREAGAGRGAMPGPSPRPRRSTANGSSSRSRPSSTTCPRSPS